MYQEKKRNYLDLTKTKQGTKNSQKKDKSESLELKSNRGLKPVHSIQFKQQCNTELLDGLRTRVEMVSDYNMNGVMGEKALSFDERKTGNEKGGRSDLVQCKMLDIYEGTTGNNERGNTPKGLKWGTQPLQRDHIIPFNTIKRYVKALSKYEGATKLDKHKWIKQAVVTSVAGIEEQYNQGGVCGFDNRSVTTAISIASNDLKWGNMDKDKLAFITLIKEIIRTSVAWMPGNIVITPSASRINDSGDKLDEELLLLKEVKNSGINYRDTYRTMEQIITVIESNKLDDEVKQEIYYVNKVLASIAQRKSPYDASNMNLWNVTNDHGITEITVKKEQSS